MTRSTVLLTTALLLLAVGGLRADTLILLDHSRSMGFDLDGRQTRHDAAAQALRQRFVPALPEAEPAALWTFSGSCWYNLQPGEFAAGGRTVLRDLAQLRHPDGGTPLAISVEHALAALMQRPEPRHLVVITDGEDTCGGDPCRVVREAQARGARITVHTVGLGLEHDGAAFLRCMSDASPGGTATVLEPGSSGAELADALARISESLEEPTGELLVEVLDAAGQPVTGVGFAAEDVATGTELRGTSGRPLEVPPGTYRLHGGDSIDGEVRVVSGRRAVVGARSELGRLRLTAPCSDAVSFALLDGGGRTLRTGTFEGELGIDLPPGPYRLVRTQFPHLEPRKVEIVRARRHTEDLGGLGTLDVAARDAAGQPLELTVEVFDDEGRTQPVATGPTNRPFPLPSGHYNVRVSQEDPRAGHFLPATNVRVPSCGTAQAELRQQATLRVCGPAGTLTAWNDDGGGSVAGPMNEDIAIAPGTYNLVLPGGGYRPNVRIREGQNRVGCR